MRCRTLSFLGQVGQDPRPVMRAACTCFQDGVRPESILAAAEPAKGSHDTFYANLASAQCYTGSRRQCHLPFPPADLSRTVSGHEHAACFITSLEALAWRLNTQSSKLGCQLSSTGIVPSPASLWAQLPALESVPLLSLTRELWGTSILDSSMRHTARLRRRRPP